jgi:hypothetical protein
VCLESIQIVSYLNLSEDRESKSYHHVPEQHCVRQDTGEFKGFALI